MGIILSLESEQLRRLYEDKAFSYADAHKVYSYIANPVKG